MGLIKAAIVLAIAIVVSNIISENIEKLKVLPYYDKYEHIINNKGYIIAAVIIFILILF